MPIKIILIQGLCLLFLSQTFAGKQDEFVNEQYRLIENSTADYLQISQLIKDEYSTTLQIHQQCVQHLKNLGKECQVNCEFEKYEKLKKDQLTCYRYFNLKPLKLNLLNLELEQLQKKSQSDAFKKLKVFQVQLKLNLQQLHVQLNQLVESEKKLATQYLSYYKKVVEKQITNQYINAKLKGKKSAICEFMKLELSQLSSRISAYQEKVSAIFWYDLLYKYRFYNRQYRQISQYCGNHSLSVETQRALQFLEKKSTQLSKKIFLDECRKSIYESFTEQKCESIKNMTPATLSLLQEKK